MHVHPHPYMNNDLNIAFSILFFGFRSHCTPFIYIYIYIFFFFWEDTPYNFGDRQYANYIILRHKFGIKWMEKFYIK